MNFKKTLILASNSFTGSHFTNYLLEQTDSEIRGVSRSPEYDSRFLPYAYGKAPSKRFAFHQLDTNKDLHRIMEIADSFRPELVVNYAAQGEVRNSWKWPAQWYETNCLSVVKLTNELCQRDYLRRYIAISTPEVYGSTGLDTKENSNYQPSTPYAASKLAGDLHIETLIKRHQFPGIFTRAANLYGIHQQLYRIIPRAIIYLKLGRTIPLHGGGKTERAFIHARDVADATWKAASLGKTGDVFHLAPDGELRTIASVVALICQLLGKTFEDSVEIQNENFGQDARFSLDASKARQELDWNPQVKFETAVEEMIAWVNDNWAYIQNLPLEYQHIPS